MTQPVRILFVEDSSDDFELILRALRKDSIDVLPERVETLEQLEQGLARGPVDAVVSDFNLFGFTGIDALHQVRRMLPDVPFILVSGVVGEELAVDAMKQGANDFVLKRNIAKLGSVLSRELKEANNRMAARLASESARLSHLCLESISEGVLITGPDRRILSANRAFELLTGYSEQELIGRSCALLQGPKSDPVTISAMRAALSASNAFTGEIINYRKDQSEFWNALSISPVRDLAGQLTHFVGIQRDVTESKRAQNRLRLANQVFSQAREAVVVTNSQGEIELVNQAFSAITGYSPESVLGRTPEFLTTSQVDSALTHTVRQAILTTGSWQGEVACRKKDGGHSTQWLTVTALHGDDERVNYVGTFIDITEQREAREKIEWLSRFDSLTGLPNRSLFADRCDQVISAARRTGAQLAMLAVNLKNFGDINDSFGHEVGDLLLQQLAQRIVQVVRESDNVSRVSGSNFSILLGGITAAEAANTAEKLLDIVAEPFDVADKRVLGQAVIGVAVFPGDGTDAAGLLQAAEHAMHAIREKKVDTRVGFFNATLHQAVVAHGEMVVALRSAASDEQLALHYQPFVDLRTGQIAGMEALLRWTHPQLGSVPPGQFIPVAEKSGLITKIGAWIIEQACKDLRSLLDAGMPIVPVSINISPIQFHDPGLLDQISAALARHQLQPNLLCLEVTEGTLMESVGYSKDLLQRMKTMGLRLSLDDFGTGYSSLSYLKLFPFDKVKIDQSFVRSIGTSAQDEVIIKIVILMAHGLGLNVIAEGVETEEQCMFVQSNLCDEIQGYLFARPAPMTQFAETLRSRRALPQHLRRPALPAGLAESIRFSDQVQPLL